MPKNTHQDQYIVFVDHNFRIRDISPAKYRALTLEERQKNTRALLNYLESIPSISMDDFKNPDGTYVEHITRSTLDRVINRIYGGFAPALRPKLVPRMPTDVCIDWISTLEYAKNELLSAPTTSAAQASRDEKISLITQLIENQKSQWLKHNLTTNAIKASLINDSDKLREIGLHDLADFAYKIGGNSLGGQLARSNTITHIEKRINENKYGAVFESLLVSNLIKNPPQSILNTMGEIGKGLNLLLDDITNKKHLEQHFIPQLKSAIKADQTHWLEGVPKIQEFIDADNPLDALNILRTILTTKPTNGTQTILIPYLVQKFYKPYTVAYNLGHPKPLEWVSATQKNYDRIVSVRDKNYRPTTTMFNKLRESKLKGFFRWDNLSVNSNNHSLSPNGGISPQFIEEDHSIKPKIGSFMRRTLEHGIPFGKGVSGTTNLFFGTLAHLIKDKNLNIDTKEALLGLTSFLVYDGGHTLHETLWTVHQRETVDGIDPNQLKYLRLGLNVNPEGKTMGKGNNFISDYAHFIQLFDDNPFIKSSLNDALDQTWKQTISHFDKKNYFSGRFALEKMVRQMIVDLSQNPTLDIKERLEHILKSGQESLNNKSRLVIATQLENLISNTTFRSFDQKKSVTTQLDQVLHYERVQHKLLNTMQGHAEFNNFDTKRIQHLIPSHYRFKDDSSLSPFLGAFNHMLKHRNEKFTDETLIDLIRSYTIGFGGAKLPELKLLRDNFYPYPSAYKTSFDDIILLGERTAEFIVDSFIRNYNYQLTEATTNDKKITAIGQLAKNLTSFFVNDDPRRIIEASVTNDKKIYTIAELVKDLTVFFIEDTPRLIIEVLVTNQLLLQNNLSPTILGHPGAILTLPLNQLVEEIKAGQEKFKSYTNPQSAIHSEQATSESNYSPGLIEDDAFHYDSISDYKEEYLSLESKLHNEKNPLFLLGNNEALYQNMSIRGYSADMSIQEMYMLAVSGGLNLKELGALTRHIHTAVTQKEKASSIIHTKQPFIEGRPTSSHQVVDSMNIDADLDLSLDSLKQTQLIERFVHASQKLYNENQLSDDWIPVLESIKETPKRGIYNVSFFDPKDTQGKQMRTIETTDETFIKIKKTLNNPTSGNSKTKKTGNNLLQAKPKFGNLFPGTGLSLVFAANAYFSSSDEFRGSPLPESLVKALQLHYYVNMTSMGIGITQDIVALGAFGLREAANPLMGLAMKDYATGYINTAKTLGLNVEPFERALPRIISMVNNTSKAILPSAKPVLLFASKGIPVVATALSAVTVGFDAYELTQAETDQQKKIFGTKLAFSSAGLGLAVGGTVAAYVGASSIAGPLFIVAIPVVVTGGAIVQVMQFYDNVEQLIDHQVLHYFDQVAAAYQKGYHYDKNTDTLSIASGAVVKKIDFENGNITLGSQYVSLRDKTDKRRVSTDNTTTINLRSALGGNEMICINATDQTANIIFLPDTPMSYVSYNTANIQAFREYIGAKYNRIRQVESSSNGEFDLEHFSFFFHDNVIHKLFHQYQTTEVEVQLDSRNRVLIVPELPKHTAKVLNKESTILFSNSVSDFDDERNNNHQLETLPNAIHYNLTGKGGQYTIGLNERATIRISSSEAKPSRWILNTNNLDKDDVEIHADKLIIGGVTVDIDPTKNSGSELIVVKQDGDVCSIDINSKRSKVIQMDAEKWVKKHPKAESFDIHLKKSAQENILSGRHRRSTDDANTKLLAQEHHPLAEYIPVDNYILHEKNDLKTTHIAVGRAYYDVKNDQMLFSRDAKIDGNLGPLLSDHVYFYNQEQATIWRVEAATGIVKAQYFINDIAGLVKDGMRVWQENNQVYVAFNYTYNEGNKGEFIFNIKDDLIELTSLRIAINRTNLFKKQSLLTFYLDAKFEDSTTPPFQFPHAKIINTTQVAPLVTIYDQDNTNFTYRYWLRTADKMLIKPDMPDMSADKALRLRFIGSIRQTEGSEIFYFLDPIENALYRQEGAEPPISDPAKPIATRINGHFVNVEMVGSNLFAVTNEGIIHQVDSSGNLTLVAVNEQWLNQQGKDWIANLSKLNSRSLMVLGMKGVDEVSALPAWYCDGQLVVAPALQNNSTIEFLGIYEGYARFFDITQMKLYEQAITSEDELSGAFGDDHILDYPEFIEDAADLFPIEKFKSISLETDTSIRLVTTDGVIMRLDTFGDVILVGVDATWQLANPNLNTSMDLLAKKWAHHGAISLQGDTNSEPAWYVFGVGKVTTPGLSANDHPEFIGKSIINDHGTYVYFSSPSKGLLYCYQYRSDGHLIEQLTYKINVQRFGSSLLMQGTSGGDALNPLLLAGITSITMSGKLESDTYIIDKQARSSFKNIIIDNFSIDKITDTIHLAVDKHDELKFFCKDDDLVITDTNNNIIVTIRKILGKEKSDYNHLKLITNDGVTKQENHITDLIANRVIVSSTELPLLITDPNVLDYREHSSNHGAGIMADLEAGYVDKISISENGEKTYVRDIINHAKGLLGTHHNDALHGDQQNNVLYGMDGDDLIDGKRGKDLLDGGLGSDTYQFSAGDGRDIIKDSGGYTDTIKFILGQMKLDQFLLQRDKNNLVLSYNNQRDSVTIADHFSNDDNKVEYIQFDTGMLYDVNKLTQTASSLSTTTGADQWSYNFSTLFET